MQSNEVSGRKKFIIFACIICVTGLIIIAFCLHYYFKDSKNYATTSLDSKEQTIDLTQHKESTPTQPQTDNYKLDSKNLATAQDFISQDKIPTKTQIKQQVLNKHKKPKVVIIIDDLANARDIKRFESLHLKLSLSLFPKQSFSKDNPKIAKSLQFYMIHLPLEAHNFEQKNVITLHTGDSTQTIESYISQIKHDFPNLKYINNHTGSLYTESMVDMQKLLQVLDKHGITFIDSLTTSKSVAKELARVHNKIYLARNVFLDNEPNMQAIGKQLEIALKIANKQGYVIAIGHPKDATYKTLKQYKDRLLKDYDMLYVNELEVLLQKHNIKDTKTKLVL